MVQGDIGNPVIAGETLHMLKQLQAMERGVTKEPDCKHQAAERKAELIKKI